MVSGGGGGAAVREGRAVVVLSVWWGSVEEFEGDAGVEGAGPIAGDAVGFAVVEVPFP